MEFELIKQICEWCWKQYPDIEFSFDVITNGCAMSENAKTWLSEKHDKINVVLSLDGGPETQNINRSNSYEKIDLSFFKENWPEIGVKMTVSNERLGNLAADIEFVHSQGLKILECNLAFGIDWSNAMNEVLFKREMKKIYSFYHENDGLTPAPIINMEVGLCENPREIERICGAYATRFVDTDGKIYPCNYINPSCFSKEELDYLMNLDFDDLESLEDMGCYNNCYLYPVCPNCYASNYKINGKVNVRDKSLCRINKIRAYYSALLAVDSIAKEAIDKLSFDEKGNMQKRIKAIKRVVTEYRDIAE